MRVRPATTERGNIMNVKKKWSPVKEILFTYLALNKILYWTNTITALNQSDLGNVSRIVIIRLLNQDLLIILGVITFYFLDKRIALKKSKYSNILEYVVVYSIGYVLLMGIAFVYILIFNLIFSSQSFSFGEFVRWFIALVPSYTIGYLVAVFALEIKQFFKKKGKESSTFDESAKSTDDKLDMLRVLLNDGVLTQEEFDNKSEILLSV